MQAPAGDRFYRGSDRIIGGVCSGIAAGLHVDPLWVRLAFVVLAFAQGIGLLVYILLWLVMPETPQGQAHGNSGFDSMTADLKRMWAEFRGQPAAAPSVPSGAAPTDASVAPPAPAALAAPTAPTAPAHNQSVLLGVILFVIGLVLLGNNTGFVNWSVLWPVILIAIGVFILLRNSRLRS
jgi:phage shock protein C